MNRLTWDKVTFSIFGILALSLFAKESINTFIFICLVLAIIVLAVKNRTMGSLLKLLKKPFSLLCISYFILGCIGFMVNNESNSGYLLRLMPILLCPLLIFYGKFMLEHQKIILFIKLFVLGNIILLGVLDVWAIVDMIANQSLFVEIEGRVYYRFLYTRFTQGDYFNHIYLSIYTFLSLLLTFQFSLVKKKMRLLLALYFLLHLFMLGSRAVVIAMIVSSLVFLVLAAFKNRKYVKYLMGLLTGLILLSLLAYQYKDTVLFNRYSQVFEWYAKKDMILERDYSVNKRLKIYIIGSSFFSTKSFEINGTGIVDQSIERRYNEMFKNSFGFNTETYNSHNQYINNFIDWGYLGVLLLIILLGILVRRSILSKAYWLAFFWIFFAFLLMMESALIRQRGIMLFVILGGITLSLSSNTKQLK